MRKTSEKKYPILLPTGKTILRKVQYNTDNFVWTSVVLKNVRFSVELSIVKAETYKLVLVCSDIDSKYIIKQEGCIHDKGVWVNYYVGNRIYDKSKYMDTIDNKFFENVI